MNVLALPRVPSVEELAGVGVARVSVGSAFAFVALGAAASAAKEFLDEGTFRYLADRSPGQRGRTGGLHRLTPRPAAASHAGHAVTPARQPRRPPSRTGRKLA